MKDIESAKELALTMIEIGKRYDRKVVCVLTNMDIPLGHNIGNGLEVIESIECLKGNGPKDLEELVLELGSIMVSLDKEIAKEDAYLGLKDNLYNNKAYLKFEELVEYQNGDINNIDVSDKVISIKSSKEGFINSIDTLKLGEIVKNIGGGRINKEDSIDYGVGITVSKKVGQLIFENEEIAKVYLRDKDVKVNDILECFEIEEENIKNTKLILEVIE